MNHGVKKKAFIIIALLIVITGLNVYADEDYKCGENVYYAYDKDTGTLKITGNGSLYDYQDYESLPWADCEITKVTLSKGVVLKLWMTSRKMAEQCNKVKNPVVNITNSLSGNDMNTETTISDNDIKEEVSTNIENSNIWGDIISGNDM